MFIINAPTNHSNTMVGELIKVADKSGFANTIRGLEVQTNRGSNTLGENTAINAFGRTFGVRGVTEGDAGGVFEPAGLMGESRGTTQGNAIRAYSASLTSGTLLSLYHEDSALTGRGLLVNLGNDTGSFTGDFLNLQNRGKEVWAIGSTGSTTIGTSTASRVWTLTVQGGVCVTAGAHCPATEFNGGVSVDTNGTGGNVNTFDVAEEFLASEAVAPGEIVMVDTATTTMGIIAKAVSSTSSPPTLVGVVSTKAAIGISGSMLTLGPEAVATGTKPLIALVGRVPVRVSDENGTIEKGDYIVVSNIAGTGMKAISSGEAIGVALESFAEGSGTQTTLSDGRVVTTHKIIVFVDRGYAKVSPRIVAGEIVGGAFSGNDSIYSRYFSTSTPAMVISEEGKVGIGLSATSTPGYELEVAGEVAAQGFINISSRGKKKDIVKLNSGDYEEMLKKIREVDVATYHYIGEDDSEPLRMGLIAEESPVEILSAEKGGVDLYKLATFTLGGLKALEKKVADLELRLEDLELGNVDSSSGGVSVNAVLKKLSSLGAKFIDGIAYFKNIVTDTLRVGSKEKPTGITLYDEATGEPYCLSIVNGDIKTRSGECNILPSDNENQESGIENQEDNTMTNENDPSSDKPSKDDEPPVIELRGNNPIELQLNAQFLDPGVNLSDNETQDIHIRLDTQGADIDTSVAGTYTITYTATDLAGNSAIAERVVEVNSSHTTIPEEAPDPGNSVVVSQSEQTPETTPTAEPEEPAAVEENSTVEESSLSPQESLSTQPIAETTATTEE